MPFSHEARTSDICRDLLFCGFTQEAGEAARRCYICVIIVLRQYPKALSLVEAVIDEVGTYERAGRKSELDITHLNSPLYSEKKDALLLIDTAAARTRNNTNDK